MRIKFLAALVIALVAIAPAAVAQSLDGLWDATITFNGQAIPFRLQIAGEGPNLKGWLFNGEDKVVASGASFQNGSLVLNFDSYAAKLEAKLQDGELVGQYGPMLKKTYPVTAQRHKAEPSSSASAPSINGLWEVAVKSSKGEQAWRLIVQQKSASNVSAAILRVDGDTGALTGGYKDGKFVLSHFSGGRPALMVLTPGADGTLAIDMTDLHGTSQLSATRPDVARAKGLAPPTDPDHHTTVKDASQPFQFSAPDLNGKIVSNTDARFQGKVVLVNITGSWCPNCHDEAPFLAELYRKYHSQGLEVVALSFEEEDQLKNPARLRAFMKEYGIDYTVLLGGTPDERDAKLTQPVNLNSWPTTFFLGRDGRVRFVHAGFPGPASGELYRQAAHEFYSQVESLLAENHTASR
ncbi:MAG TPA: TlpA disulfide reductase family protein [Bryobacteraceae bacterium]|nr:TlpA disulfide reductase family protein [Bryobacteraceae bacterium]